MRRSIVPLALAASLAVSCSEPVAGPAQPASFAEIRGAPAMLQAQARAAVLRFVDAYRDTVLGGDDLEGFSGTPLLRRFAHWLGVTNRAFPGEITATSTVSGVGPAVALAPDGRTLEVELSAQIQVVAQPPEGDPLQLSVPLDGPVRLVAEVPGAWRVADFVRFGVPVSRAFLPIDLHYRRPGVEITLDSFGGVPNWSFFVRITAGSRPLTLEEADVTLVDAEGATVRRAIEVSVPLLEIAPGQRIEGALTFDQPDTVAGVSLRVDLNGRSDPAALEVPLRSVVEAAAST